MPGRNLDKMWPHLTEAQRLSVIDELRGYVLQLRGLKNEADYNQSPHSHTSGAPSEPLCCHTQFDWHDHNKLVFVHGDLAPRNILVEEKNVVLLPSLTGNMPAGFLLENMSKPIAAMIS